MSPSKVSRRIVLDRIAWVDRMLRELRSLPLADRTSFLAEGRAEEVSAGKLFEICSGRLDDLERVCGAYHRWMGSHPDMVDTTL
jgi:hypothetical protein